MPIPRSKWGRDHLSLLLYLETRCVDHDGWLVGRNGRDRAHLRCDPVRHYLHAHQGGVPPGTRLKDGTVQEDHDDWDCLDDLVHAGYVEWHGTGLEPRLRLTHIGWKLAHQLRRERATRSFPQEAEKEHA